MNYQLSLEVPSVSALTLLNDHYGMMSSFLRLAAIKHFDVYNFVWSNRSEQVFQVGEFAKGLQLEQRPAVILLSSLIATGDLELAANGNVCLTERSRLHIGDHAQHADMTSYLSLLGLPPCIAGVVDAVAESLKENSELPFLGTEKPLYPVSSAAASLSDDEAAAEGDALAMAARARCLMPALLQRVYLEPADGTLVSIGCGPAVYSVGFLIKYGRLSAIGFDHENKRKTAEAFANANDVGSRFDFRPGNMLEDELPRGDFYLLSSVLHDWGEDTCIALLKRLHRVASRLLIHDVFPAVWSGFTKPEADYSALLGLITPGQLYSQVHMEEMLRDAGYRMLDQPRATAHLYSCFWAERE